MDLTTLAQQATNILAPVLPFIYVGSKAVADKSKDMLLEKGIEKVGSEGGKRAKLLLEKISVKKSSRIERALTKVSENSEYQQAKKELQFEILELLKEDPNLAREIELTVNLNVKNINQLAVGNYNNFFNIGTPLDNEYINFINYLDQKRKEARTQETQFHYNPSILPYYPEKLKNFVIENRADELRKALRHLEHHRILLLSGVGGVGKSTLARALVDFRPVNVPEPFWFSFWQNSDAKVDDILEKLAVYLNAPEIMSFKAEGRELGKADVNKLTDELKRRSQTWLIFDDLNTVLEDTKFNDKGIELLFSTLQYNTHNAKIIITSRILPTLKIRENLIGMIDDEETRHICINDLETSYVVDYLERNGLSDVEPYELRQLAKQVGGHPLSLKLLTGLVIKYGTDDILEDIKEIAKSACRESQRTPIRKIACDISKEVNKWEIGSQEEMTWNIENLIFSLESSIPKVPQNQRILDRIQQIREQKDVPKQYVIISTIIPLIPQIFMEQKIDKFEKKIEALTLSLSDSKTDLVISAGFDYYGNGIKINKTIPFDIFSRDEKEEIKRTNKIKNIKLTNLSPNIIAKVKNYLSSNDS